MTDQTTTTSDETTVTADAAAGREARKAAIKAKMAAKKEASRAQPAPPAAEEKPPATTETPAATPPKDEPPAAQTEAATETPPEESKDKTEKGRRAREWADARALARQAAIDRREAKREKEQLQKDRAEFSKIQQQFAELNQLMEQNPAEYLKRVTKGNLRPILQSALVQDDMTEEQRTIKALEEKNSALEKRLEEFLGNFESRQKQEEEERAKHQQQTQLQNYRQRALDIFETHTKPEDFPLLHSEDHRAVAAMAVQRIIAEYQETGVELDPRQVFSQMEDELEERFNRHLKARKPTPTMESAPVQDDGAGPSQQSPGAKKTPTLSNGAAASRAAGDRPLTKKERMRRAASKLRRTG